MQKIARVLIFIFLLFQPMAIKADSFDNGCCTGSRLCFDGFCRELSIAVKVAAFFPLSSKVQRIYSSALPEFTLEGNLKLFCNYCGDFYLWLDGSYIYGNGHSYGYARHSTHLDLVPITLGVKYVYHFFPCLDTYLGIGASYAFLNVRDHDRHVHRKFHANDAGVMIKSGIIYRYSDCFYIEGFFNYNNQYFHVRKHKDHPYVEQHDADLSSLQLGIALGRQF